MKFSESVPESKPHPFFLNIYVFISHSVFNTFTMSAPPPSLSHSESRDQQTREHQSNSKEKDPHFRVLFSDAHLVCLGTRSINILALKASGVCLGCYERMASQPSVIFSLSHKLLFDRRWDWVITVSRHIDAIAQSRSYPWPQIRPQIAPRPLPLKVSYNQH